MNRFGLTKISALMLLVGVVVAVAAVIGSQVLDPEIIVSESLGADSIKPAGSEPSSAPLRMKVPGLANHNPTFLPQNVPIGDGLSISVNHSVTVAADKAYVVIVPAQVYGPTGPIPISNQNRAAVIAKLGELGIAEDAVEFTSQSPYGGAPSSLSVAVQVGQLPQIGEQILDAVEDVLGRSESHGVRFGLTPAQCDQAQAQVRRQAVDQANKIGDDLAQALGVQQGSVTGAAEYPFNFYGPVTADTCGSQFQDPYVVEPFDSDPEVDVALSLQVLYTIEPAEPAAEPPGQP